MRLALILLAACATGCAAASAQGTECTRDRDCIVFHGCARDFCRHDVVIPRSALAEQRRRCGHLPPLRSQPTLAIACTRPPSPLIPLCASGRCTWQPRAHDAGRPPAASEAIDASEHDAGADVSP